MFSETSFAPDQIQILDQGKLPVEGFVKLFHKPLFLYSYQAYKLRHTIPFEDDETLRHHIFWIGDMRKVRFAVAQRGDNLIFIGTTPDSIHLESKFHRFERMFDDVANSSVFIPAQLVHALDMRVIIEPSIKREPFNQKTVYKPELLIQVSLTDDATVTERFDVPADMDQYRVTEMVLTAYTFNAPVQRPHVIVEDIQTI